VHELATVAPAFVDIAHRIVWATVATTTPHGRPATRVLHPIWDWDGTDLVGWIATGPTSPKARHLAAAPYVSLTYWDASQDTCTADCDVEWLNSPDERRSVWRRFVEAPPPLGYDPSLIPAWPSPDAPGFGVIRLTPTWLRVMPGSLPLRGEGEVLSWRRSV
jgi:hypothetical protein